MGLTRGVDSTLKAALVGHFHPVALFEVILPSETVRCHTGAETISWATRTWLPFGRFADFSSSAEVAGGLARPTATVQLVMTLEALLLAGGAANRFSPLTVWWGATTEPGGGTLIGTPMLHYAGYVDQWARRITRSSGGGSHGLEVGLAPGPAPRDGFPVLHSPEAQEAQYPGDTGFRHFVNAINRATNPPLFPEP